ncbi:MAG TPA: hypothetical protein VFK01_02920, partial [Bradyrhizobium sp.]|nr:hypothetical protein [Bradyrhizobium sp.]
MKVLMWREKDADASMHGADAIMHGGCGIIPRSFDDDEKINLVALPPQTLTANFRRKMSRAEKKINGGRRMPYAVTKDKVRLYFEEAGSGTPIIFLHEYAADHTNWEPQMRYFSRGHRCIA